MTTATILDLRDDLRDELLDAAHSSERIQGFTHSFYRYPARFSPRFAAAAIECFSNPGDLILDPFMGSGTTVIEALVAGRRIVGNDINALGVFVARVKTLRLADAEIEEIDKWATRTAASNSYGHSHRYVNSILNDPRTRNLDRSKFLKKGIAQALYSIKGLSSFRVQAFTRCILLDVAQWALDGKNTHTSLGDFRQRLYARAHEMLTESQEYSKAVADFTKGYGKRFTLVEGDASKVASLPIFAQKGEKASLTITSPPYPGVHVLYHRWQVDGRKETPAPYWITCCQDSEGESFYTFGDRRENGLRTYFETLLKTFTTIRQVMREGAYLVQLVAFGDPRRHLP